MAESLLPNFPQNKANLDLVLGVLLHPKQAFSRIGGGKKRAWVVPLFILSLMTILALFVNGYFQSRSAVSMEPQLPPDWQYWTPEMQNDFMEAQQATQSPTIIYIFPIVSGLVKLWLGWVIIGGMLHLFSTLMGGRETITDALNIYAFSILPFALRDILRVVFMLVSQHPIRQAGLSGFAGGDGALFWGQMLANLDLFLVWHAILLIIGFHLLANLPYKKAVVIVLVVLALSLLTQAGMGALNTRIRSMLFPGSG